MDFHRVHIKGRPIQSLLLVCLLTLATLWLSSATAAHIHLDDHNVQCELCLTPNSGEASLENNPPHLNIISTGTSISVELLTSPILVPVAPRNSRAPPSL